MDGWKDNLSRRMRPNTNGTWNLIKYVSYILFPLYQKITALLLYCSVALKWSSLFWHWKNLICIIGPLLTAKSFENSGIQIRSNQHILLLSALKMETGR